MELKIAVTTWKSLLTLITDSLIQGDLTRYRLVQVRL